MKTLAVAGAAILASTTLAFAGGVERSAQSVAVLFEEGTYAELGFSFGDPNVSGTNSPGGASSGDMTPSFTTTSLSYRRDLSDQLSFALIFDNHVGADANYMSGTGYPFAGATATLDGRALTALLRYEFPTMVSVYGGVRVSQLEGDVALPPIYSVTGDAGTELGYVLGVAYERPDIALRVSLTYSSAIEHSWTATETVGLTTFPSTFETTIPESWHLEFQTGIAEDTLLFGSVRWVEWTDFQINPPIYDGLPGTPDPLVVFRDDRTTYMLGVGRRFNESWAGSVAFIHEPETNSRSGNLGPTDGRNAIGLGLSWQNDQIEISGGVQYSWLGGTFTNTSAASTGLFTNNDAVGAGIRIGFRF